MQDRYEIHFAPLQGYTDYCYRCAHHQIFNNIDYYYTPFLRVENKEIRKKDIKDILAQHNNGTPLIPQILPANKEEFIQLCDTIIAKGYRKIDINFGCPFPPIVNRGKGSGILPEPEKIANILNSIQDYSLIDFSIKMRLGLKDSLESTALVSILNETPLQHITIHPRLGVQQYKGSLDIDSFHRLYEQLKHPIIFNGDINSIDDFDKIINSFPRIKGVMIGRGLLKNPSIAHEINQQQKEPPAQFLKKYEELHNRLFIQYESKLQGESQLLNKMQTFWDYHPEILNYKLCKSIKKCTKLSNYNLLTTKIFRDHN